VILNIEREEELWTKDFIAIENARWEFVYFLSLGVLLGIYFFFIKMQFSENCVCVLKSTPLINFIPPSL
jgi:hypothetical protein